jgi:hypothetical protein
VQIRFTKAAGKHLAGRRAARYVMATTTPRSTTTKHGDPAWLYVGRDDQGRYLEVIAIEVEDWNEHDPYLLVIHLMELGSRKRR